MSVRPWRDIERRKCRQIMVGNVPVGADAPIAVQSMTNTLTTDVAATVAQIRALAADAKAAGLVVVIWSYPRGSGLSKEGETAVDVVAVRVAPGGVAGHPARDARFGRIVFRIRRPVLAVELPVRVLPDPKSVGRGSGIRGPPQVGFEVVFQQCQGPGLAEEAGQVVGQVVGVGPSPALQRDLFVMNCHRSSIARATDRIVAIRSL
mgnify:CR=1 FL=1